MDEQLKRMKAPFPWFGGKRPVADAVWQRLGDVRNYVEPFFGSGAVLLCRPEPRGTETVNDKDGFLCNFWRSVQHAPEAVAEYADCPVNENDLHARHSWLIANCGGLAAQLEGHPEYFDPKIAGWWVWGISCWIGRGWCNGRGAWASIDGVLVKSNAGHGINRQLPYLGSAGMGVNRQHGGLTDYMNALSCRLRDVRVCCGDWRRIMGPSVTTKHGLTGVFLDPPYSAEAGRDNYLYAHESLDVAQAAAVWARENGDNPLMRIALCGYDGEHDMPSEWEEYAWNTNGGYGMQGDKEGRVNASRERIWFSPHCLGSTQKQLDFL